VILASDAAVGRQFAAFSFTAVAISSRGTPDDPLASGVLFSFALFAMLAAAGFLCGLTSSVLADVMNRQLTMTQTKDEGTSHEFAEEFGGWLRLIGGLNAFAGMFLATATFHFLMAIFDVSPGAVLPLGAIWLIGGSVCIESFRASFSYWSMLELSSDIGEFIDRPDQVSPSPVTGTIQQIGRYCIALWKKRFPQKDKEKDNKSQ
jgi:hypothetical protein